MSSFTLDIAAGADAFGDGSHPSTQLACAALEALAHLQGARVALDMGCGSGILALQMAYQWHIPVVAVDIEAQAVDATRANAEANGLAALVHGLRSDGYAHPQVAEHAPYDVICSNILAEKLIEQMRDLVAHLADEGVAVLSGIYRAHAAKVEEAIDYVGLSMLQRLTLGDWVCLVVQK
jgi:ribosomal protein L11 methyltransferase